MKKNREPIFLKRGKMQKLYKIMKLSVVLMIVGMMQVSAAVYSQNEKITVKEKNISLSDLLWKIQNQTDFVFTFNSAMVEQYSNLTVKTEGKLEDVLKEILKDTDLDFKVTNGIYVINKKAPVIEEQQPDSKQVVTIVGTVKDTDGVPIPGANIIVKDENGAMVTGNITNAEGNFRIEHSSFKVNKSTLVFSFIGMQTQEVLYVGDDQINVVMVSDQEELGEIVVTGIVNRKAESFTGAVTTVKREELLRVSNQNIFQSLKNIDPSFVIEEDISLGSDPNSMPDISIRGKNSIPNLEGDYSGNPNQPLFVLDGFETTIQKVYDLDMNRVASITLLKDAAAKAIYGSRAANGVVVIETVRPETGELRVTYVGDLTLEVPDLTGYNLMDAQEKLAFEKERGMYTKYVNGASGSQNMDNIYKQNYDNVVKGVDTYWLSQPLQTGVGTKHSISLEGGDERFRYQTGVFYNKIEGAMKGSDRNTFAINATLSYTYKNLIFRNSLEYTRNTANNSPYGTFSEYINLNPYYQPYDENGNPNKILGQNVVGNVYNPLYNATLNTKDETGYSEITDNFNIDWKISNALRATGQVSYTRNENSSDVFYPASHTMFSEYDENGLSDRKGKYTKGNGVYENIATNAGINYNKAFGRHLFFANATWNLTSRLSSFNSFTAEGFGNDNMDNVAFASQYEYNGKPTGTDARVREIGLIGILNYSFDNKYLFDASIRNSGSSMYGSDNRWGTFWALGVGWNVHHEKFMKNVSWIQQMKLRSSYGYTGSQNFDPFQARARYVYGDIIYNGRLGAELLGLPNNSLRWQRTLDFNSGLDLMIKSFLSARFDYYVSTTKDLLSDMTIVPSMGFSSYKENLGEIENKGYELAIAITPWRNNETKSWFTINLSATHNESEISEIYDIFTSWNDSQNDNLNLEQNEDNYNDLETLRSAYTRPKTYFYEGQSMTAIWGVRSLGIDPVSGKEMYLDKNGNSTWVWSADDQVVIGDTNPTLRGTVGFNAGYKGLSLSLLCTYKFGGDIYNTTLIDRVENVTGYDNLDRRILDSWRNVGDVSPYKALNIDSPSQIDYTKPTSRFVQKDNELYLTSLNVSYDFPKKEWMDKIGLERLRTSFYTNELLRLSSVEIERGTSYPFARTFSFSLQATF